MDDTKLLILDAAFETINEAVSDWALAEGCEKEGIWYVSGIAEMTKKLFENVRKEQ